MVMSFVLSFFPRGVLDEILNLIEAISGVFPSYSCHRVCESLTFLLDNIYFRFGSKLYKQIPVDTNCALFVADLFLVCNKKAFMLSLSEDTPQRLLKLSILHLRIYITYITLTV